MTVLAGVFYWAHSLPPPPRFQSDVCNIFKQYPEWYWATLRTESRWGVPVHVQMAILHQESHFRADAKPPRQKILGVIPWVRPTTAFGYSQALNGTWSRYQLATGHLAANRASFKDATNFVGWYAHRAYARAGIPKTNAYQLYLAYHEGIDGYTGHSYNRKPWLLKVSQHVDAESHVYASQLKACEADLPKEPWWQVAF